MIKEFNEVIQYSQGFTPQHTEEVLEQSRKAKQYFIDKLGGYIYEYPDPVTVNLSQQEKQKRLQSFIDWIEMRFGNYELSDFIWRNKDGFFDNRVVSNDKTPDGAPIDKGMKLLKAFKYFEDNKDALTEIQNKASTIIQEDKITGTLCISVHPLDFLSLSENTYNWRSCHSLDGDYRAGNLSYMLDECTIICYIKGKEDTKLPRFPESVPWNSKKWRCLIFVSEQHQMLFASRPYPFESKTIIDLIREILINKEIISRNYYFNISEWSDKMIDEFYGTKLSTKYLLSNFLYLTPIAQIIKDAPNSRQYNDVLNSNIYKPLYCWTGTSRCPNIFNHFTIGAPTYCLCCGNDYTRDSSTFLCESCEQVLNCENIYMRCDYCGSAVTEPEGIWLEDDTFVCDDCLKNYCRPCDSCGENYLRDSLEYIKDENKWICEQCRYERRVA